MWTWHKISWCAINAIIICKLEALAGWARMVGEELLLLSLLLWLWTSYRNDGYLLLAFGIGDVKDPKESSVESMNRG